MDFKAKYKELWGVQVADVCAKADADVVVSENPALRIEGLRKVFGGTVAPIADGEISVRTGEIHGLLGENGAGKSTLIKVLAGAQRADGGTIGLFGEPIPAHYDPDVARGLGLAFIHQDLGLVPDLSVAENIALVVGYARRGFAIDWRAVDERARQVLAALEVDIDPGAIVASLPLAGRATVAIARALAADAKLLVLDEPTASLAAGEVAALFDVLRALRSRGLAIVFVSHRMDEVLSICDRVTVLRDGRTVGAAEISDVDERSLLRMIVGRDLVADDSQQVTPAADRRLSCVDIRGSVVGPLSLAVHTGEIVGVSGLSDSGHLEVGELLFGLSQLRSGTIALDGAPYRPTGPRDAIARGLAYVPPDRVAGGLAAHLSVQENLFAKPIRPVRAVRAVDNHPTRQRTA